jgi:hypothetical protein
MLLVPDFGKVAGDLELHTLVRHDLPRTFFPETFVNGSAPLTLAEQRVRRRAKLCPSLDARVPLMGLMWDIVPYRIVRRRLS